MTWLFPPSAREIAARYEAGKPIVALIISKLISPISRMAGNYLVK